MAEFILDPLTGDLDLGIDNAKGLQIHVDPALEAAQRVSQALGINIAEWFADITKGLPYMRNKEENIAQNLQYLFGDKSSTTPVFVYNTLTSYIRDLPFVTSVSAEYTFDDSSREFRYIPQIIIQNGEEISFPSLELTI